jgi:hypothetical protein
MRPGEELKERFAIQVGFWIFGGMSLQLAGEDRKVINIH